MSAEAVEDINQSLKSDLSFTFKDTDKETFMKFKKDFARNKYPFSLSEERREKFDQFMVKYVIDEDFLTEGIKFHNLD